MIEKELSYEKKMVLQNEEYMILYTSIMKHYPSALMGFDKIQLQEKTSTASYELKFSNEIAKNDFKIIDNQSLAQLFDDIHLNTTNLFDFDPYSPGNKPLRQHLLESTMIGDNNNENKMLLQKIDKTPQIKKFLTTYKKKSQKIVSNGAIPLDEGEAKYRICLIKFYHNEKLRFLLNMEDTFLEEEVVHLRELDKGKDEMLASITHDLRSPLSSMLKCIEFAKESNDLKENRQNLALALSSGMMLMNLISDILDYSLMKNGKFKLNLSYFQLEKLVDETTSMMRVQGDLKNIKIINNNNFKSHLSLYSDFLRIKQILVNLIGNSLKFTNPGGEIILEISTVSNSRLILLNVIDNGVGIKPEIIPKLCKPFQSFDYEGCYNKQGIGLGLHICTNIISQLGPEKQLKIESTYEKGSKFSFVIFANCSFRSESNFTNTKAMLSNSNSSDSIPVNSNKDPSFSENISSSKIPVFPNIVVFPYKDIKFSQNEDFIVVGNKPRKSITSNNEEQIMIRSKSHLRRFISIKDTTFIDSNPEFTKPCNIRILLVDDDVFILTLMKKMILKFAQDNEKIKIEIDSSYNGEEALKLFEKNNDSSSSLNKAYDLVFLDRIMPIKDGEEAALEMRKLINEKGFIKVRIFCCTAWQDSTKCVNNCMDGVLIKPVEISKILEILEQIYINKINSNHNEL